MSNWVVAQAGRYFYTHEFVDGMPTGRKYDPRNVSGMTARHYTRTKLREGKAKALVDKLNGSRGDLKVGD